MGGWGLRLNTQSMAKAGVCIMNKGKWEGKQLVSAKWIDEASQKHNNYSNPGKKATDTNQGYCYQMWRCLLPGAFRADGAYGQFIVMSPKHDLVVVITGVSSNTGKELACIWNQLIPGVKDAPLPANASQQKALDEKLATAALPLLKSAEEATDHTLMMNITFSLEDNVRGYKQIVFSADDVRDDECVMTIACDDGRTLQFPLKSNGWAYQHSQQAPPYNNGASAVNLKTIDGLGGDYVTAGTFAWINDSTLAVKLYWTNWIVPQTFTFAFNQSKGENDNVTITNDEGYPGCDPEVIKATCGKPK